MKTTARRLGVWIGIMVLSAAMVPVCAAQTTPSKSTTAKTAAKRSRPVVQERSFASAALQRTVKYNVVLPVGYESSQKRYPVLYLLHGWNGDHTNWVRLTNLVKYAEQFEMIIVTPDAGNSWYVNSATVPENRVQNYVVKDLIEDVDQNWRTIAAPHRRAIAGLSMGGYGSVLLAMKYPGLFAVAGSISGAFDGPTRVEHDMPQLLESVMEAYGPADSTTRAENDVYQLSTTAEPNRVPYLYIDCGSYDPLLESNRKLVRALAAQGIRYEYHEYAGAHTWEYWDRELPELLRVVWRTVSATKAR